MVELSATCVNRALFPGRVFDTKRQRVHEANHAVEQMPQPVQHGVVHKSRADDWLAAVQREQFHEDGNIS